MVDAVSTANAAGRINTSTAMLASNFETFLTLLTTQLKNQDPLSPLDSNEFTAQLTQMAGVEQQLLTNDLLTSLLKAQQGDGLTRASSYIGQEATAVWSTVKASDGEARWSYELAQDARSATLRILDSQGRVAWSGDAPQTGSGVHDFVWSGASDGEVYSLEITAKDASGADVASQVLARGRVTGVEIYNGEAYATIGGAIAPVSAIIALDEQKLSSVPVPSPADESAGA
jgi:flagellar basal-body rod modification protein FlgD